MHPVGEPCTRSVAFGNLPFDEFRANGESEPPFEMSASNHGPGSRFLCQGLMGEGC